jgi:hypothetical protein
MIKEYIDEQEGEQIADDSRFPIVRLLDRIWMGVLRAYLLVAAGLVLVRIVSLASSSQAQ